jgi:hypothetical protein
MSRKIITLKDICNENEYFHEIELLLEDAKNNPVPMGTGHYHHIIPRSWYKLHKMMVDSRKSNLVYLSIENHYKIHDLMSKCMKEPEMVFRMKNAAAGLKDYKPNYCIKKTKIKKPKNKLRPNRGLWKNYLNNHIEELNKISFNNQIEYLNNLNPQIKYQVLRRIIENKFVYREAKDKVKMLKQGKIDEKLVLLWLN